MIQIIMEIKQRGDGKSSICTRVEVADKKKVSFLETQLTNMMVGEINLIIEKIAVVMPCSEVARGHEDVETLMGMADLDLKKDEE